MAERYDDDHCAAQLAAREIDARLIRATSLMSGPVLIILLAPRRPLDELITRRWDLAGTIARTRTAASTPNSMRDFRFKAKDSALLKLFRRAAHNLQRTGELLDQLLSDWPESQELRAAILDCEHVGDRITHDLIHALHTAPPRTFDREDLFALAVALDDIVDFGEEVADYLGLYQIEAPMEGAQQLARVGLGTATLIGCGGRESDDAGAPAGDQVFPLSAEHKFGTTSVPSEPQRGRTTPYPGPQPDFDGLSGVAPADYGTDPDTPDDA